MVDVTVTKTSGRRGTGVMPGQVWVRVGTSAIVRAGRTVHKRSKATRDAFRAPTIFVDGDANLFQISTSRGAPGEVWEVEGELAT